ncbi:LPXTG cell wall anchor domain-containing protein [Hymenobacter sp. HMF4947]|uniref:histidine kinase n=1 Tax=Hymenobacter ginkgonis TaxID=2682976 RepID=A0A7K1TDS5_9BACT|nr:LPXTG cell wall anchor domain-containing protein [Hymenobacter ginkgonis]
MLAQLLPDAVGVGHAYSGLGDLSRQQQRWAQARYYYKQAAASYCKVYNAAGMLPTELSLIEMTEREGYHDLAFAAAPGLLVRARQANSPWQEVRARLLLASIFLAIGQPDSALHYGTSGLAIAQRNGLRQETYDAAKALAKISVQQGRWQQAYHYQYLVGAYADSLTGEAARRRVAALELTYARSQQQSQIRLLTQRTRLQAQQQELDRLRYHQQVAALTILGMLLLLLGGYLLWRYRRREQLRLAALRTRIAADLHDEVGSMLTQISMQSNLLREGRYAPAQQQAYLDQMSEASLRAARQMSDAVWSIDARYDSAASLLDRLRDHAHQVLPAAGVELDFWADPALTASNIPLATRQALYFIYKEALHNVVKHARAQQVRVRLRLLGRQLELTVHDDGQGLGDTGCDAGQGLRNMRMRALSVGGSITLANTKPGIRLVARLPLG